MKINEYLWKVIIIVKRFYQTEEEFQNYYEKLKLIMCPYCNIDGCLILHGYLYGYSETDESIIRRGHRIYCSNRNRKNGCGRTFSILVSVFIKDFITSANSLWLFLKKISEGKSLASTFRESGSAIGQAGIYRILRKFRYSQPRIRTLLTSIKDPPRLKQIKDPAIQTINHLKCVFKDHTCPVSQFQHHFQTSFL